MKYIAPWLGMGIAALGVGMGLALSACDKTAASGDKAPAPAIPVRVAEAVLTNAPVEIETFGTVKSPASVVVKSQVSGILTNIHFREGQMVAPGDLLFTIDARPFEAAVARAEAALARNRVQLENAEKEAEREKELLSKGLTAQDVYDTARTTADALAAEAKANQAACDDARLQLEYCYIRSPIQGRAGAYLADAGNLVKANDVNLVTLNQIRPIQCVFSIPQQQLERVKERFTQGELKILARIPEEPDRPESGALTFLDNSVDTATGTLKLKGIFANDSERLWPGQFVRIILLLADQPDALVVPSEAVQTGQKGPYVFVVKPDSTVEERRVQVDRQVRGSSIIVSGLEPGERVVTDGLQRLVGGVKVDIKPDAKMEPAVP